MESPIKDKRQKRRYRLFVMNENTFEEVWHVRMSRVTLILTVGGLSLFVFALLSLLILFTPLRYFLPGGSDARLRSELVSENMRLDSLSAVLTLQTQQMDILKQAISGQLSLDSVPHSDSIQWTEPTKVDLSKSAREQAFCDSFADAEKYNLGILEIGSGNVENFVFMRPVRGIILRPFEAERKHFDMLFGTADDQAVVAVQDGIVVLAAYTLGDEYVIAIQHQNGFISVYKNMGHLLKQVNQTVKTGEPVAIAGLSDSDVNMPHIHFELWRDGQPVDPADYIIL